VSEARVVWCLFSFSPSYVWFSFACFSCVCGLCLISCLLLLLSLTFPLTSSTSRSNLLRMPSVHSWWGRYTDWVGFPMELSSYFNLQYSLVTNPIIKSPSGSHVCFSIPFHFVKYCVSPLTSLWFTILSTSRISTFLSPPSPPSPPLPSSPSPPPSPPPSLLSKDRRGGWGECSRVSGVHHVRQPLLSDSPPLLPCSECGREPSLSSSSSLLQREADLSDQLQKFFSFLFSLLLPFLPSCPFSLLLWLTLFNIRLIHILEMEVPVDITRWIAEIHLMYKKYQKLEKNWEKLKNIFSPE